MDDFDAHLYSLDDPELFDDEESDNDVLDDIDEQQAQADSAVVLVPASSPARETEQAHGDERPETSLTASKSMSNCNRVLTEKFGFSAYKGKQKEIIQAAIAGADVFVLAPTGMGKSLCFQIPAIAEDSGVSIVVSPLLALMKNQVATLCKKGISAISLTSETAKGEKSEIMRDLTSKKPKNRLFYTTPEKLCTQDLMQALATVYSNGQLTRLVVDEAHCISEWGHDFREEYRKLGSFRERFPGVPIMALTATATKNVQRDIVRSLKMIEDGLFTAVHPFNRANLYYEVRYESAPETVSQMQDILEFIEGLHRRRNRPSSGIIYCRKRETCDDLSNYLRGKGLNARPYHRGVSSKTLNKTLKEWEIGGNGEGGVDVVCATIAFGMGIDKSDVRYIIHYDLPKSMEGYYQETGRAGRDGLPSRCVLYYSREDALRLRRLVSSSHARRQGAASSRNGPEPSQRSIDSLGALVNLAENVMTCRHVSICRYFGEIIDMADDDIMEGICDKMCDVCKYPDRTRDRKTKLSDEDYAAAVISKTAWNAGYEDDDDSKESVVQPQQQPRAPAPGSGSKNAPDPGQKTLWDCLNAAPVQELGFKRPNAHGWDKLVLPDPKRAKVVHTAGEGTRAGARSTGPSATMPPPLITRPYSSSSSLRKPFKTPFKVQIEDEASRPAVPNVRLDHRQIPSNGNPATVEKFKENDSDSDVEIMEVQIKTESDMTDALDTETLPEVDMQVEVPFSRKIHLDARTQAWHALRRSLHRAFPLERSSSEDASVDVAWRVLPGAPTSVEGRAIVVAGTAKTLEHEIHMMCATQSGYETRVTGCRRAMEALKVDGEGIREEETKKEIMDALKRGVKQWQKERTSA